MRRLAAIGVVALVAASCVRPCMCKEVMAAAVAMDEDGRTAEAVALLEDAASRATTSNHADHLHFQAGLLWARAGRLEEALEIWDPLYDSTIDENIAGRIVYEKGMLYRELGMLAEAEKQFELLVMVHPEHGLAYMGLTRLMKLVRDRAGDDAIRELLEGLLPASLETTLGDDVMWELHLWHMDHGEREEARSYLLAIRHSYPFPTGGRADSALMALAAMAEEEENWQDAVTYLEEIIGPVGKSPLIGSSSSSSKAKALIRLGRIYEFHLDKPKKALTLYMEVVHMKEQETLNDDGMLEAARVLHGMGEEDEACDLLHDILDEFPWSNKRKKALARIDEWGCAPWVPPEEPDGN